MRQIREILRLRFEAGLKGRVVVHAVSVALSAVQAYCKRFDASSLDWPTGLDEEALKARLYPRVPVAPTMPASDFAAVQSALASHDAMTRRHLWQQ